MTDPTSGRVESRSSCQALCIRCGSTGPADWCCWCEAPVLTTRCRHEWEVPGWYLRCTLTAGHDGDHRDEIVEAAK